MSTFLNPQWLQHFYQFESSDELQRKLLFTNSVAEIHMLETEIKRREAEEHATRSELPQSS